MHFRFIKILAAAILALSILKPLPAAAQAKTAAQTSAATQRKAEISLYGKTLAKPSVKAADKFLKKYPQSVYAPKIQHLKDSLLTVGFLQKNVSQISKNEALKKANASVVGRKTASSIFSPSPFCRAPSPQQNSLFASSLQTARLRTHAPSPSTHSKTPRNRSNCHSRFRSSAPSARGATICTSAITTEKKNTLRCFICRKKTSCIRLCSTVIRWGKTSCTSRARVRK